MAALPRQEINVIARRSGCPERCPITSTRSAPPKGGTCPSIPAGIRGDEAIFDGSCAWQLLESVVVWPSTTRAHPQCNKRVWFACYAENIRVITRTFPSTRMLAATDALMAYQNRANCLSD